MSIPQINCSGTPYEIGHQHGAQAAELVHGSIQFYAEMFDLYTGKTWAEIRLIAVRFGDNIQVKWPRYFEEMQGIADGAQCHLADILALNTRTEVVFGLMVPERVVSDGCTSLYWARDQDKKMGQNWDWMEEQGCNIVLLTIHQTGMPVIKMVTEAGIIGKIGMNSAGVGVCLNAVRCSGHDIAKIPIHLALRLSLESETLSQAVDNVEAIGAAGSAFLLLAQGDQSMGLEMTSTTTKRIGRDSYGRIMHTNHLLQKHDQVVEWPEEDSFSRYERITQLTEEYHGAHLTGLQEEGFLGFFDDHEGTPFAICRRQEGDCKDATLFNITMDLDKKTAVVRRGKVCHVQEEIRLDFS
ncbi:hypothetical protein PFICI_01730 [Pestalotiopsis fici W106-1]|uniref:Peptidase C45 hydrolase domain-containing protein n=1 Tax=Pestalotiopsis fici (strain W106-1 / CGMCC3.15140) TaxID=1229662 RepID=W3XQW0_PESFW|nr:uncharacterized protein PFICI_01730 [Pestalotiopsis fici W106-1]ETS87902.1 hypothetical protein PFICI_01730 [Pestalotiopsis fici W106-1]